MEIGTNIYLSKIGTDDKLNNNPIKVWVSEQVSLLELLAGRMCELLAGR